MDSMIMLVLTILGVLLLGWLFRGVRLHKSYRGDIYEALYGSFLPYFYRYVVIRDCSQSSYLRGQIGTHRIVFSAITNDEKQRTQFCMIFYNKGVMVICYDKAPGEYRGKPGGKSWNVVRTGQDGKEHIYRRPNPTRDIRAYLNRIVDTFPDVHIEARLAFCDSADVSRLTSEIKAIHFNEIEGELKAVKAEFLPDDEVKGMYQRLIQK